MAGLLAAVESTEIQWTDEYRIRRGDGATRLVIDRGFVIRGDDGKPLRMIGSIMDITDQRHLEERLRQSQKLEAVGQLTGGVAHDFNNILTVILGNAELLSESMPEGSANHAMATMTVSAAERGAQLTSRLLAFARRQPLEPRPLDLNALVSGLSGLLGRALKENIELEIVRGLGLWVTEVDPGQLEVALLNLVVNARDAMPEGGKLTIETANASLDDDYARQLLDIEAGQYVMISVCDTGVGMSPDTLSQVFEPFFTTKDVGKGSGLGLSMVYGFVRQSGGHVRVYSEPGEGTCVRMYFPRVHTGAVVDSNLVRPDTVEGGREHVLVVEDDTMVRDHLVSLLRGLGYRVTAASQARQALQKLRTDPTIDLLFTDIVMPGGMNGRELADIALAERPGLKVLFMSGYTENAVVHHGRLDAGVQLLSKPYRRQALAAKLRKVLEAP